jgi:hypothetical protein
MNAEELLKFISSNVKTFVDLRIGREIYEQYLIDKAKPIGFKLKNIRNQTGGRRALYDKMRDAVI